MTNQEWLCRLNAEDFLCNIKWLLQNYGKRWTDSDSVIIEWLQDKREVYTPKDNGMTREEAIEAIKEAYGNSEYTDEIIKALEQEPRWIPVSERLPKDLEPVNITWVNHSPESYYTDIKDKPFTATGHYYNGRWWWYSVTCQDYLNEYGRCDVDAMDDDIEVIAWKPLPEPYKAESEGEE